MNGSWFAFNEILQPWAFLLVPVVILLLAAELVARAPGAVLFSTGSDLSRIRGGAGGKAMRCAPAFLRALGLTLLIFALARPVNALAERKSQAEIIDIMLCVDVSPSMQAQDFVENGELRDRLYVTKQAVRHFMASRKERVASRFGTDRIGLILYAGYAWTQCPLTLDYGVLEHELDRAFIDETNARKQKTAIGSAIALAVSRLRKSEAKSKVVVLMTDGMNNAGEIEPRTAAQLAKEYGIRIYAIGAGSDGRRQVPQIGLLGFRRMHAPASIDEDTLKGVAEISGGRYYRAIDVETLHEAYKEIDALERTEVEAESYYDYQEAFAPYAAAGMAFVGLSLFSRRIWFDPIP